MDPADQLKDITPGDDIDPRRVENAARAVMGEASALDERLRSETVEAFEDSARNVRRTSGMEELGLNLAESALYISSVDSKENVKDNKNFWRSQVKFELKLDTFMAILIFTLIIIASGIYSYLAYIKK